MKTLGAVNKTNRGFEIIEFSDINGQPCSLQKSSLLDPPALWLGCNQDAGFHHVTQEALKPRMHLNRKLVEALVETLNRWLETGSFK